MQNSTSENKSRAMTVARSIAAQQSGECAQNSCIVGSLSLALHGIPIQFRDADVLSATTKSSSVPASFEVDVNDGSASVVVNSNAVSTDSNPFVVDPLASLGWSFPKRHWQDMKLGSHLMVSVPIYELSILLKLKAFGDRVSAKLLLAGADGMDSDTMAKISTDFTHLDLIAREGWLQAMRMEVVFDVIRETGEAQRVAAALCHYASYMAEIASMAESRTAFKSLSLALTDLGTGSNSVPSDSSQTKHDQDHLPLEGSLQRYIAEDGAILAIGEAGLDDGKNVPAAPYYAHIQLISDCNLKCHHCPYVWTGKTLSLSKLEGRLMELRNAGVMQASFGASGEALLFQDLPYALDMCAGIGIVPNLNSNLTLEPTPLLWRAIDERCGLVATSLDRYHFPNGVEKLSVPFQKRLVRILESGTALSVTAVYAPSDLDACRCALKHAQILGIKRLSFIRIFDVDVEIFPFTHLNAFVELLDIVRKAQDAGIHVTFRADDPIVSMLQLEDGSSETLGPRNLAARHSIYLDVEARWRPSQVSSEQESVCMPLHDAWMSPVFSNFRTRTSDVWSRIVTQFPAPPLRSVDKGVIAKRLI